MYRIGQGWDRHRLAQGKRCVLGGVEFPDSPLGPVAHSDGDVVCHAVCDALLGALALGDIGQHFPDTATEWADADSVKILSLVYEMVSKRGYAVANVDCTVVAEEPQISPVALVMAANMARVLDVAAAQVSVKATRGEGVGPEGRRECITVHAVALLRAVDPATATDRSQ